MQEFTASPNFNYSKEVVVKQAKVFFAQFELVVSFYNFVVLIKFVFLVEHKCYLVINDP